MNACGWNIVVSRLVNAKFGFVGIHKYLLGFDQNFSYLYTIDLEQSLDDIIVIWYYWWPEEPSYFKEFAIRGTNR